MAVSQHEGLSTTLVMRRFFAALQEENLMAAELWIGHPNFAASKPSSKSDGPDYYLKLDKLVGEGRLSLDTIAWLLLQAKTTAFFRRANEQRRRRLYTWRGHIAMRMRNWITANLTELMQHEDQVRCCKLAYELGWLTPEHSYLQTDIGRKWLLLMASPAKALALALHREFDYKLRTHSAPNYELIDALIAKGPLDLSEAGGKMVAQYKEDGEGKLGRALVLRLIENRDRSQPMPDAFTDMITEAITLHKLYLKLSEDLPTLLGAKTYEDR